MITFVNTNYTKTKLPFSDISDFKTSVDTKTEVGFCMMPKSHHKTELEVCDRKQHQLK
jgi:hypothetical protein